MKDPKQNGAPGVNPRVLLLIPSYAKHGIEERVKANTHPTMDYHALQGCLKADLADYGSMEADRHLLVRAARWLGRDTALAMHAFLRVRNYQVIFSNGENVGIPLAALMTVLRRRPGHVLIGHRVSAKKKKLFLRALHSQIDALFLYAAAQQAYARDVLQIPTGKLHLIPFHADTRFYQPMPDVVVQRRLSSAGLELRDYPTLIEAVRGLDVDVRLAAASPWSKRRNETSDRELPPNVGARSYGYDELRELYATSQFIVVPLYDNDFQAGVTTMLEAMAMGKAVIVTKTRGQRDVIQDGINGIYVPPGDPGALRDAISGLLAAPDQAAQLGANARRTIESEMSLDLWTERISRVVREVAMSSASCGTRSPQRARGGDGT